MVNPFCGWRWQAAPAGGASTATDHGGATRDALAFCSRKLAGDLLYAKATAAMPKEAAAANARLNKVIHMSRSVMIAGGSAIGLSVTGACMFMGCGR